LALVLVTATEDELAAGDTSVELEPVSRATVAAASRGVSKQGRGKQHGEGPEQAPRVHPAAVEGRPQG
jgi:hypothetical protein